MSRRKPTDDLLPLSPGADTALLVASGLVHAGANVLDVGCGLGDDAVYMATAGCRALGIDLSPTATAYARALARNRVVPPGRADFRTGGLDSLGDLRDAS